MVIESYDALLIPFSILIYHIFWFMFAAKLIVVNIYMFIILILMITNFKYFFIKMLELFINKQKPYNHSNYVHERWIVIKLQLENDSL